jgi:hypothetical protein
MSESVEHQESGLQVQEGKEVIVEKKLQQKKKRVHVWTDAKKAAFEKCRAARMKNIQQRKEQAPKEAEV